MRHTPASSRPRRVERRCRTRLHWSSTSCGATALQPLLRKAERAWSRKSERNATLAFTDGSFPDYRDLPSREAVSAAHAVLRNAERAGAITIEWDRHAGDDGQVKRLRLTDPNALSEFLGHAALWRRCEQAAQVLQLSEESPPVLHELYAEWCAGKEPRKLGPERVKDFVDAQVVLAMCADRGQVEDLPLRRLSVAFFGNTKRIEAITPALDVLTGGLAAPPRTPEEVWAALGLVKFPQPVLIAGNATLRLHDGTGLAVVPPYLGIPADTVAAVSLPDSCDYVLTVENLTTFNELARGRGGPVTGCIVYTGGMPSPTLRSVYSMFIAALAPERSLWHWGDIDVGGFRIAAVLHAVAQAKGRSLRAFKMNPAAISGCPSSGPLVEHKAREMVALARSMGWQAEAAGIEVAPRWYEQEALPPALPAGAAIL